MTPYELREKWHLKNAQLRDLLGKEYPTIKAYMAAENTTSHRNPPKTILILCEMLDSQWQREGLPLSLQKK